MTTTCTQRCSGYVLFNFRSIHQLTSSRMKRARDHDREMNSLREKMLNNLRIFDTKHETQNIDHLYCVNVVPLFKSTHTEIRYVRSKTHRTTFYHSPSFHTDIYEIVSVRTLFFFLNTDRTNLFSQIRHITIRRRVDQNQDDMQDYIEAFLRSNHQPITTVTPVSGQSFDEDIIKGYISPMVHAIERGAPPLPLTIKGMVDGLIFSV